MEKRGDAQQTRRTCKYEREAITNLVPGRAYTSTEISPPCSYRLSFGAIESYALDDRPGGQAYCMAKSTGVVGECDGRTLADARPASHRRF